METWHALDPYALLGVTPRSSLQELRAAYYELALLVHPDRGGRAEDMRVLAAAYAFVKRELQHADAVAGVAIDACTLRDMEAAFAAFATDNARELQTSMAAVSREFYGEAFAAPLQADGADGARFDLARFNAAFEREHPRDTRCTEPPGGPGGRGGGGGYGAHMLPRLSDPADYADAVQGVQQGVQPPELAPLSRSHGGGDGGDGGGEGGGDGGAGAGGEGAGGGGGGAGGGGAGGGGAGALALYVSKSDAGRRAALEGCDYAAAYSGAEGEDLAAGLLEDVHISPAEFERAVAREVASRAADAIRAASES